jgi:6-phosphogluconate dehydrogenase (decarboxylating)
MEAGFMGVGNMGLPMAGKLLDGGHNLTVYDIRESAKLLLLERQARRAASPDDLSDARYKQPIAMPMGLPKRPSGVASIRALPLSLPSRHGRAIGVSTKPG